MNIVSTIFNYFYPAIRNIVIDSINFDQVDTINNNF